MAKHLLPGCQLDWMLALWRAELSGDGCNPYAYWRNQTAGIVGGCDAHQVEARIRTPPRFPSDSPQRLICIGTCTALRIPDPVILTEISFRHLVHTRRSARPFLPFPQTRSDAKTCVLPSADRCNRYIAVAGLFLLFLESSVSCILGIAVIVTAGYCIMPPIDCRPYLEGWPVGNRVNVCNSSIQIDLFRLLQQLIAVIQASYKRLCLCQRIERLVSPSEKIFRC